jgi:hypothetical protein
MGKIRKAKDKQKTQELIGKSRDFLLSNNQPLEERAKLLIESYKHTPSSGYNSSLINENLTLLNTTPEDEKESFEELLENQEEFEQLLENKKNEGGEIISSLERTWSENLLYSTSWFALKNQTDYKPVKLMETIEQFLDLEQPFLAGETPRNIGNMFYELGKITKNNLIKKNDSQLERQIYQLSGRTLSYVHLEECEKQVFLKFNKPLINKRNQILSNELEFIFNCFIAAYDFYEINDKVKQADTFIELGKLTKHRPEIPFCIEFYPELKNVKTLLKERLEISNWKDLPLGLFSEAQKILYETIESAKDSEFQVRNLPEINNKYNEASQYLLKVALEKVDLNEMEQTISDWKPRNFQHICHPQNYVSLHFELAKLKTGDEQLIYLTKAVESANHSFRDWRKDTESYTVIYALLAQIKDYVEEEKIDDCELKELLKDKDRKELINVFREEILQSKDWIELKEGVAFIPKDKNGMPLHEVVLKKGKDKEEIKKQYFLEQVIYQNLKSELTVDQKKVPFVRPLDLWEVETAQGTEYFYFMKHEEGFNLEKIMRFKTKEKKYLSYLYKINGYNKKGVNHRNNIIKEQDELISSSLKILAYFGGTLANKLKGEKSLEGEVKILTDQGILDEKVSLPIKKFDYLENLVERLLVGRDEKVVQDTLSKLDSGKINQIKVNDKRLGLNESFHDFFIEYKKFVNDYLSEPSLEVILHNDPYLGNIIGGETLIDPKYIRRGNPLVDLSYFLENVSYYHNHFYSFDHIRKRNVDDYLNELSDYVSFDRKEVEKQYDANAIHSLIGHISGFSKQGKVKDGFFYCQQALEMMDKLKVDDLKIKFIDYIKKTNFYQELNIREKSLI